MAKVPLVRPAFLALLVFVDAAAAARAHDGAHDDTRDRVDRAAAQRFLAEYADFACSVYERSVAGARTLAAKVEELVSTPDDATLAAARNAWLAAREAYGLTEVLRFYGGPIDDRERGPETFINAWPVDEAYIDAVSGRPRGGIVLDAERFPVLDATVLRFANERGGEANVCLGWHAIEFLLWGQDLDAAGPGRRSPDDFRIGGADGAARRARYLRVVCAALIEDLASVRDAWAPARDNFRRAFLARPPSDALRDALRGMVVLTGFELAGERLAVAYETKEQEQEHSCFSDNTHRDLVNNQRGIAAIWAGETPGAAAAGLRPIAAALDPSLAAELDQRMAASARALAAIPVPFDQAILGADDAPGRRAVLAAIEALEAQTESLAALGLKLGFVIPVRPAE